MSATSRDLVQHAADRAMQVVCDTASLAETDEQRLTIMMSVTRMLIEATVESMEDTVIGQIRVAERERTLAVIAALAAMTGKHPPTSAHDQRVVAVLAKKVLEAVISEISLGRNPMREGRHGV